MGEEQNRVHFTDAADDIMQSKRQFTLHYFERPNASTDTLNLARSLFDLREYRKCAHMLKPYANEKYQSALFLYNYALYTVSELSKEEEALQAGEKIESACSAGATTAGLYRELAQIEASLQPLHERGALNGINLYLYGVVLKERNKKEEAKAAFAEALTRVPLLWSSWLELGSLIV